MSSVAGIARIEKRRNRIMIKIRITVFINNVGSRKQVVKKLMILPPGANVVAWEPVGGFIILFAQPGIHQQLITAIYLRTVNRKFFTQHSFMQPDELQLDRSCTRGETTA